ncbi:MAG: hypothetical protein ABR499_19815 [Gemmatimonadaceae bacterium]
MTRKFLIVTALVAGLAATAEAQLCTGSASFSAGRMRVGVGAEFPDGVKAYGAGLLYSHRSGAFFGGQLVRQDPNGGPESATDLQANVGYETSFDGLGKIRFCPTGHFGMTKVPDAGNTQESVTHYGLGGAFGGVLSSSDNMTIAPSLGLNWVHYSVETTTNNNTTTVSDSWMEATLGAGFIINRDVTFTPMIRIPLNQDGLESSFGFSMSYNFGRPGGATGGRRRR